MDANGKTGGRCVGRISTFLAVVAAGGLGAGLALLVAPGAGSAGYVGPEFRQGSSPAHILKNVDQGGYTHTSDTCSVDSRSDPINVIFHGAFGKHPFVDVHASASSHGGWDQHQDPSFGEEQYFWDHDICEEMDGSNADAGDLSPTDRWHMRYNQGPDVDPLWEYYTVAAAHHEDYIEPWVGCHPILGGHAVDSNDNEPPGGFNDARAEVYWKWTVDADDGHVKTWQEDWDNTQVFEQCDGENAWSNGMVFHIEIPCAGVDPSIGLCDPSTTRVSVSSSGEEANALSMQTVSAISDDGRFVPFYSFADNLVTLDTNGTWDAFVRDRATGITERVSVSSSGEEGDDSSYWHLAISADGRFVTYTSEATNLVAGDTNGTYDIFVRDRESGVTERVSVASDETESNGSVNQFPSMSANGRFVAFTSDATNLVPDDNNDTWDVFIRDREAGTTERVSVSSSGEEGNDDSGQFQTSISQDGRFVAFASLASNLVPDDANNDYDIFVHDRQTGETERVSVSSLGLEGNNTSWWPSISDDGRYVAFKSWSSYLVPGDTNTCRPQHDPGECPDVFVHDRWTGSTERVSVSSSGEEATGGSDYPDISGSGRFVAFPSDAANLVPNDTNDARDIFVHDRETGLTQRVNVSSSGGQADGDNAWTTAINYDGTAVVFVSWATNLVADDTNGQSDVFVRSSTTDSDGDGIPDTEDNCPAWYNPDQSLPPWSVPPDDVDCDGFRGSEERFVGTDPVDNCPDNLDDDAWPADMVGTGGYGTHDGTVNILDLVQLTPPVFGSCTGDPLYAERKDFNGDGCINILDIVRVTPPVFGSSCS